jgi:two-component system phosphoglycerate transport system response regulator PgtA
VKILLVDDNADFTESTRAVLEMLGYEVRCYLNGHDFLRELARAGDADLLITDYYLPDLNGIELLTRARATLPGLKAILLTGSRESGILKAARRMEGCRIEFKPIDWQALEHGIRELDAAQTNATRQHEPQHP